MDNIFIFPGYTTLPIPTKRVLKGGEENLHETLPMLLLGYDQSGEFYIASNQTNIGEALMLLELAKQKIMEQLNG